MNRSINKSLYVGVLLLALVWSPIVSAQLPKSILKTSQEAGVRLGIVQMQPEQGRFVETEHGYMVPYESMIPGTKIKFTMEPIPGGTFLMGSHAGERGRNDDEGPQFEVVVEPFWMSKYELTWAEYKRFMDLSRQFKQLKRQGLRKISANNQVDAVSAPSQLYDPSYSFAAGEGDDQPAATVTQFSAMQYSKWISLLTETFYRLPSESEWEYACRAGTTSAYHFGNDPALLRAHAWYSENSDEERHRVGMLKPNPWGLHDMHGNVAEWVLDAYAKDSYATHQAKRRTAVETIQRSKDVFPRVVRGGSFESEARQCRSAARLASDEQWQSEDPEYPKSPWWYTDSPATGVGFRLIRPLIEPASRAEMEIFWVPGDDSLKNATERAEYNGRGATGIVDPQLPAEIIRLKAEK